MLGNLGNVQMVDVPTYDNYGNYTGTVHQTETFYDAPVTAPVITSTPVYQAPVSVTPTYTTPVYQAPVTTPNAVAQIAALTGAVSPQAPNFLDSILGIFAPTATVRDANGNIIPNVSAPNVTAGVASGNADVFTDINNFYKAHKMVVIVSSAALAAYLLLKD